MVAETMYVNSAGVADQATPLQRDAINRLRARASAAKAQAATATPNPQVAKPAPPAPPRPGVVNRTRAAVKNNPAVKAAQRVASSRAGRAAGIVGRTVVAPLAAAGAIGNAAEPDSTARYAERFGVSEPTGDGSFGDIAKFAGLRAGGFASDLADNLSGGIVGRLLYRDRQPGSQFSQPQQPAGDPAPAPNPGAADPSVLTEETPAGSPLDNPGYVPGRGTGIVRNLRSGSEYAVSGTPGQAEDESGSDAVFSGGEQPQNVDIPNLALTTDVDGLNQFLGQVSVASQQLAGNKQLSNRKRGIVADRRNALEFEESELKNEQRERINEIERQMVALNDDNDPGGARRAELQSLRLTLEGGRAATPPTDSEEGKYLRKLTEEAYNEYQSEEERAAADEWVNQRMQEYRDARAGVSTASAPGGDYQEGGIYVDDNGNRAKYVNGEFVGV